MDSILERCLELMTHNSYDGEPGRSKHQSSGTRYPFGLRNLIQSGFLIVLIVRFSSAYIEPSSTSFLVKILLASLAGVALAFRRVRLTIGILISKLTKGKGGSEEPVANEPQKDGKQTDRIDP